MYILYFYTNTIFIQIFMQMWTLSVINWFRWSFEQSRQRSTCRCEFSLKSRVCDIAPEGNTLILEIPKFPQKRSVWHVEGSRSAQNQLYPFCNLDRTHADLWWTYECLFIALSLALIINCRLYGVFKNPLSLIICVMLGDVKLQYLTWPVQRCSHVTFQHFWMLNRSTVSTFKNVEPSTADTFSIR